MQVRFGLSPYDMHPILTEPYKRALPGGPGESLPDILNRLDKEMEQLAARTDKLDTFRKNIRGAQRRRTHRNTTTTTPPRPPAYPRFSLGRP